TTAGLATTTPEPFDEDAEIAKISASCFHYRDFGQLADGKDMGRRNFAIMLGPILLKECLQVIGLTELRRTLNFAPLRPWQPANYMNFFNVSEPTIEAYYDIVEPRSFYISSDKEKKHENNLIAAVPYLDSRFPSIRKMFRRKFDEIFESCGKNIDPKTIDEMNHGHLKTQKFPEYQAFQAVEKIRKAVFPSIMI
ncbi:Protein CBG24814, partial [Caenorhabditis briggsae]